MKKIINRVKVKDEEYIKVLNIVEDKIIRINIFSKVELGYREIFPNEVNNVIGKQILDTNNDILMSKEELVEFCDYIEDVRGKSKESFKKLLEKNKLIDTEIRLVRNMAGVEYTVIQSKKLPYAEVIQLYLDENGTVKNTSTIPMSHSDLIIVDIIPHINLLKDQRLIKIDKGTFYGIKKDGNTIVIAHMHINGTKEDKRPFCVKAYAVKKTGKVYNLYSYDEVNDILEVKIRHNVKELMDYFIEKLDKIV